MINTKKSLNDVKKINELLLSIRNLLILQLSRSEVPILDIVKAAKIRSNDIYKIISKSNKSKKNKGKNHE